MRVKVPRSSLVAVGQGLAVGGLGDVDGGDVLVGQRGEFAGLADAILVVVAPDSEISKTSVAGIHLAVEVGVLGSECGKAVGGIASTTQGGVVAE